MKRFKLISATAIALVLSLVLAASVAANNHDAPSNLTAELCGDAVCMDWTPPAGDYDFQQVRAWTGSDIANRQNGFGKSVGHDSAARMTLEFLNIEPSENPGATAVYSFQIAAVKMDEHNQPVHSYSNHVTLELPRPVIVAPPVVEPEPIQPEPIAPATDEPTNLTGQMCGDFICLSWTPSNADHLKFHMVQVWQGSGPYNSNDGRNMTASDDSSARIPLIVLNLEPAQTDDETATYSFRAVGVANDNHYSEQIVMRVPRPFVQNTDMSLTDPSNLSVEYCGENICVSWTPGEGDYHYQGIKFWKTDDPDDRRYHGGVAIIPNYLTEYEFTPWNMDRRPRDDKSVVSYTFWVEAVAGPRMDKTHVGYSNTVTIEVAPR